MARERDRIWEQAIELLELARDAGGEVVRDAYFRKIKEHPPDRSPEMFQRIRAAYEELSDPRRRAQRLLDVDPDAPFTELLDDGDAAGAPRRFVGLAPWLAALRD